MNIRSVKLGFLMAIPVLMVLGVSTTSWAYPPFLAKAEKYGAKDCTFCHTNPGGGKGWNARGQWLIGQKKTRHADQIDVDWLADYKGK